MIKIGLIGYSTISRKSTIPAIEQCDKVSLGRIGTRDKRSGYSYQDILESDADAVYVSLPVGLHYEWGKKVLESGKHLLLEKTFTETLDEAEELFEMSKDLNLICMESLMYEFHPLQSQIHDLLPELGNIKSVEAYFGFPHFENKDDIRYKNTLGGGATLDCLVYPLSFVFSILGYDYYDFESKVVWDDKNNIDESGYIRLQYDTALANISYGFGHAYRNEITIWGDEAILNVKRVFSRPEVCDEKINIIKNGQIKSYDVQNSNHFVNMLDEFSKLELQEYLIYGTLERMKVIERI